MGLSISKPTLADPEALPAEICALLHESHPESYTKTGTFKKLSPQNEQRGTPETTEQTDEDIETARIEAAYYRHKDPLKVQTSTRKGLMEITYLGTENQILRLCMCCEKLDKDPMNILEARRVAIHAGITDIDDFMKLILEDQSHGICEPCNEKYYGDYTTD